jgi:hypothetical protein
MNESERNRLLEDLKDLILLLKKRKNLPEDIILLNKWKNKAHIVTEKIKNMDAEDRQWFEVQYREWYADLIKEVKEVKTKWVPKTVYQFSWVGQRVPKIKPDDPRWIESRRIAEELSRGGYKEYQLKYSEAINFHAVYVNPKWRLPRIGRIGNHIFYENPPSGG